MVLLGTSCSSQSRPFKDALIFDLKGNVKSCTTYTKFHDFAVEDKGHKINFQANGQLVCSDSTIVRDSQNRITEVSFKAESLLVFHSIHKIYKYDNNLVKSCYSTSITSNEDKLESMTKYYYNENGIISKEISKDLTDDKYKRIDLVYEYTYLSYDDKGNWTEREYEDPTTLSPVTQKRIIEYYK